jgi:hypothetical protein
MPARHTAGVNKWLNRQGAWQYALMLGVSTWLVAFIGYPLLDQFVGVHHHGSMIFYASYAAVGAAVSGTCARQMRLHRLSSQQRYSDPGPMLPYANLESRSNASKRT